MAQPAPEVHQAGQALLAADLAEAVARHAWPTFNPRQIQATLPALLVMIRALIQRYGQAAAVHAAQFYRQQRAAAGVPGRIPIPMPPAPSEEQVQAQLQWAVSNLYGPVTPEAEQAALTNVQGVTENLVLDQSRQTIIDAVQRDKAAKGWARVPEAAACSFCLLLATRGAVYKSSQTADFKSHDHCKCHAEPVFNAYEPSATVRAAQALYRDTPNGSTPAETRNNFRVALQRERDAGRFTG